MAVDVAVKDLCLKRKLEEVDLHEVEDCSPKRPSVVAVNGVNDIAPVPPRDVSISNLLAPAVTTPKKRGHHVKDRPQMQKHARDGQKNWAMKVLELRREWQQRQMWEVHPHFQEQIRMCNRLHIKSQHECLLRQLQFALADGLIRVPKHLSFSASESNSFLGWTGFEVVPSRGEAFRRKFASMFAQQPQDRTLNNTLRRAGLVPERGWGEAWSGLGAFVFDVHTRAQYSEKKHCDYEVTYGAQALEAMREN